MVVVIVVVVLVVVVVAVVMVVVVVVVLVVLVVERCGCPRSTFVCLLVWNSCVGVPFVHDVSWCSWETTCMSVGSNAALHFKHSCTRTHPLTHTRTHPPMRRPHSCSLACVFTFTHSPHVAHLHVISQGIVSDMHTSQRTDQRSSEHAP
jgi:hypothetical protein